jgi:hypothetical protein
MLSAGKRGAGAGGLPKGRRYNRHRGRPPRR